MHCLTTTNKIGNIDLLNIQTSLIAYMVATGITKEPTIRSAIARLIINKFPSLKLKIKDKMECCIVVIFIEKTQ